MTTTREPNSPTQPIDDLEDALALLGALQLRIVRHYTDCSTEHQAIDAKYAPILNPLLRQAQAAFGRIQELSDAHRGQLLRRDSKTAKRHTGTIAWRNNARVEIAGDVDELIARIKALGPSVSRKLLRRRVITEVDKNTAVSPANRTMVAGIEGIEIDVTEIFRATPSGGFMMSSNSPYWPNLEGLPGPEAMRAVMETGES